MFQTRARKSPPSNAPSESLEAVLCRTRAAVSQVRVVTLSLAPGPERTARGSAVKVTQPHRKASTSELASHRNASNAFIDQEVPEVNRACPLPRLVCLHASAGFVETAPRFPICAAANG